VSRPRLATAATAALALLLAACPSDGPGPQPDPTGQPTSTTTDGAGPIGGTFYYSVTPPRSLDPAYATDVEDQQIVAQVFDSLTAVNADLRVVPAAAERWESNPESTVFTFHLREGATFHDGEPVTADSFVRAWQRILDDQRSLAHFHLRDVRGYDDARATDQPFSGAVAIDPLTLQVTLAGPMADFPAVVSYPALAPVPSAAIDQPDGFEDLPVGNGPFVLAEPWQGSEAIRVRRFDAYKPTVARLDEIVFKVYGGDTAIATAYRDFQQGLVDFAPVPPDQLEAAVTAYGRSEDGYTGPGLIDGPLLASYFYGFNIETPPFDDPDVRRAFSLLVDRTAIAEEILEGTRLPATSLVAAPIGPYQPQPCRWCEYDPAQATALIGDRELPTPIELWLYESEANERIGARVVRDINAALGAGTVRVHAVDPDDYAGALRSGAPAFFLTGWAADYPTPDNILHPLFSTETIGAENLSRFNSPELQLMLETARMQPDLTARATAYEQAEQFVLEAMPVVPIVQYRHTRVVASRVRGFVYTALKTVDMARVSLEAAA